MTLIDDIREDAGIYIEDFGVDAVYSGIEDGLKEIKVIFDKEYPVINAESGEMENLPPTVIARTVDVAKARHKDTLEIEKTIYEVKSIDDDNHGITTLTLAEKK